MHKVMSIVLSGLIVIFGLLITICAPYVSAAPEVAVNANTDSTDTVAVRILDKTATKEINRLDLSLSATSTGGFASDFLNVDVSTDNRTGYTLYMNSNYQNSSDYTTALVNQSDSDHTIPTLTTNVTKDDFSAAKPDTPNANKWGYSLDDAIYRPIPANTSPSQIAVTSAAATSSLTPVYIGANANLETQFGAYENQLTFSAVANPIPTEYTLHFEPGTTDVVENLPEDIVVSEVSSVHVFTIPSTIPSRTGYNFTGYSDDTTTYQPGDTIVVRGNEDYTGSATLTAQWSVASYTVSVTNSNTASGAASLSIPYGGSKTVTVTPNTGYYLSSVSCPSGYVCTGYSTGTSATGQQTVTVTNSNTASGGTLKFTGMARTFTVTITNSHTLSGDSSIKVPYNGSKTVTVTPNSNYYLSSVSCPSGYTCTGYTTGANGLGKQTVTVTNNAKLADGTLTFTGAQRSYSGYIQNQTYINQCKNAAAGTTFNLADSRDNNIYLVTKLADGHCWMGENLRLVGSRTLTSSNSDVTSNYTLPASTDDLWCNSATAACIDQSKVWNSGNPRFGAYYNWYTVTAGTGTYSSISATAPSSVCPKGWRLPVGSEWTNLNNYYTYNQLIVSPFYWTGGEYYQYNGKMVHYNIDLHHTVSDYHSSQSDSDAQWMDTYFFFNDYTIIFTLSYKYYGFPVRCIAR